MVRMTHEPTDRMTVAGGGVGTQYLSPITLNGEDQ